MAPAAEAAGPLCAAGHRVQPRRIPGEIGQLAGDPHQVPHLLPAAQQLPRNAVIQDHLGAVFARRGRWQEAIAAWTALARTYSGEPARKMVNGVLGTAHREGADSVKDGGSPT